MGGETVAEESQDTTISEPVIYMLTTYDNPYDPFTQWDEWLRWDMTAGYNTCGLLDRVVHNSHEIAAVDQYLATREAIDEIVRENVSGMHKKVKRGDVTVVAPPND